MYALSVARYITLFLKVIASGCMMSPLILTMVTALNRNTLLASMRFSIEKESLTLTLREDYRGNVIRVSG